jgi:hypothetical protein
MEQVTKGGNFEKSPALLVLLGKILRLLERETHVVYKGSEEGS